MGPNRLFRILFAFSIAIGVVRGVFAQELMFRSLTVNDGLSVSHVSAMAQDSHGFLWFGTAGGGLNRFDGYDFEVFRHRADDPSTISSNTVLALHVDGDGTLWVGTDRGLDRFDEATENFTRFQHRPEDDTTIGPGGVESIASDSLGRVWLASNDNLSWIEFRGTVSRLDPATGTAVRFDVAPSPMNRVAALFVDSSDNVWAGIGHEEERRATADHGLYRYDGSTGTFIRVPLKTPKGLDPGVMAIEEGAKGDLWIGTWGSGLARLGSEGEETEWYVTDSTDNDSLGGNYIEHLASDSLGRIWAITIQGPWDSLGGQVPGSLTVVDRVAQSTTRFGEDPINPNSLGDYFLRSVFFDTSGTLWVGTSGAGLRYADAEATGFTTWAHDPIHGDSLDDNFVRSVCVENSGRVWVGTALGLNLVDRQTGRVRHWRHDPARTTSLGRASVEALHMDRSGRLWLGTAGGLALFEETSNTFSPYWDDVAEPTSGSSLIVKVIRETRDNKLMIGTEGDGLKLFDPGSKSFSAFPILRPGEDNYLRKVTALEQTRDGTWWIGGYSGLTRFDRSAGVAGRIVHDPENPNSISSNLVSAIFVDRIRDDVLWVGTMDAGLNRLDIRTGRWRRYDLTTYGVPDNLVYAIQAEQSGALWLSTNHGLVRFDPESMASRVYGIDRGIQSLEFNYRAAATGPDGEVFFGGVAGLTMFHPERISDNSIPPKVVITHVDVMLRDSPSSGTPLQRVFRFGSGAGPVVLSHRERDLVFDYAALHFTNPQRNAYQIRLDGFDQDWRDVGGRRQATYTNLEAGQYTFRVRAANSHGVWSTEDAEFAFSIRPPFWSTWWFRALAALSVVTILWSTFRWRVRQLHRREMHLEDMVESRTEELRSALSTIEAQARHLSDLDEAKSRFFANVSHEFRTPLTLTLGPLQDLREGHYGELPEAALEDLDVAIRNARRLLRLVNQLLDTAKIEAGQVHPKFQEVDLGKLVDEVVLSFSPLAERRGITTKTSLGSGDCVVWADQDMLDQVFTNLLSNAMKFTPEGGSVQVRLGEHPSRGTLVVEVQDSGGGIPAEMVPHIFDRFYQASESTSADQVGTGLGLALAKELVELHHGDIDARSVQGLGTTLTVTLKTGRGHLSDSDIRSASAEHPSPEAGDRIGFEAMADADEAGTSDGEDLTTVLVVDDSAEIRRYVRRHLEETYRVIEAEDGLQGLDLIRDELPDVVVSDVIMPRMNGIELCRAIKDDPELEFLPVILLTAKASTESRVEGLESGADDYLTKPFEVRELQARVGNLIASRRRLQERFEGAGPTQGPATSSEEPGTRESAFALEVRSAIDEHLTDQEFGVEELAQKLNMSRVHLYRRLREELDQQPSELIIGMRLDRAAQLLSTDAGSVAEVAYGVGFKSVSHFTRRFRQRFEMTPSAFRQRR
jgi:signal transduction histidine kinase/ligand-binding sensor domain-containing protein/DNA-binding response OmpR family regulator